MTRNYVNQTVQKAGVLNFAMSKLAYEIPVSGSGSGYPNQVAQMGLVSGIGDPLLSQGAAFLSTSLVAGQVWKPTKTGATTTILNTPYTNDPTDDTVLNYLGAASFNWAMNGDLIVSQFAHEAYASAPDNPPYTLYWWTFNFSAGATLNPNLLTFAAGSGPFGIPGSPNGTGNRQGFPVKWAGKPQITLMALNTGQALMTDGSNLTTAQIWNGVDTGYWSETVPIFPDMGDGFNRFLEYGTPGTILIKASSATGIESGDALILSLSDPADNAIWTGPYWEGGQNNQFPSSVPFICPAGWLFIITDLIVLIDPTGTNYWVINPVCSDAPTENFIGSPDNWGNQNQSVFIDSSFNLWMTNLSADTGGVAMGPLIPALPATLVAPSEPAIGLPCTPCAGFTLDAHTQAGRLV